MALQHAAAFTQGITEPGAADGAPVAEALPAAVPTAPPEDGVVPVGAFAPGVTPVPVAVWAPPAVTGGEAPGSTGIGSGNGGGMSGVNADVAASIVSPALRYKTYMAIADAIPPSSSTPRQPRAIASGAFDFFFGGLPSGMVGGTP